MLSSVRSIRSRTLFAAGLVAASLALVPAAGHATPAFPIPIGAARHLPLGTVVTVAGTVSVPSGVFSSSFFDEGFAVEDFTGGIYVSMADNLGLHYRQHAQITGTLTDSGGLLVLIPTNDAAVKVHGTGPDVIPIWVRTGSIGEITEGLIVQVVGTITHVEPDLPFGNKIFVNDGSGEIRVYLNLGAGIDFSQFAAGQHVIVTGFSGQFGDYEIDVRFPSDIRRIP
jgi:hypothetical protein